MTQEEAPPRWVTEGTCVWSNSSEAVYVHGEEVWYRRPSANDVCLSDGRILSHTLEAATERVLCSLALGLAEMHDWAHRGISACAIEEENHAHDDEYRDWRTEHMTLAL